MVVIPWGWDVTALLMCVSFILAGVDSFSGTLPPPQNLSLSWDTDRFHVNVHWKEPADLDKNCKVNYTVAVYYEKCPMYKSEVKKTLLDIYQTENRDRFFSYESKDIKNGICVGIKTNPMVCANKSVSKELNKYLPPPPAIVENFSCAYYAEKKMNCTWNIVKNTPDLHLRYRKEDSFKHCKSYITYETMKTGCHLHDDDLTFDAKVYFAISGTEENHLINNSFVIYMQASVKPPKPKVYITQESERLHFHVSTPNFIPPHCLKYRFMYTKCNEKNEVDEQEKNSTFVEYDIACKYTVQGLIMYSKNCWGTQDLNSDLSEPVYYGEDDDPNLAFKVAIIITPLIVCCSLIAAIVLFRRNKDIILPKIPEPSLFFKDMLNSTSDGFSKSLGGVKLYVPVKEIVASGVSLEPKSLLLPTDNENCI